MSQTRSYGGDYSSDDTENHTSNKDVNYEQDVDNMIANHKHHASFRSGINYEELKQKYGGDEAIVEKVLEMYRAKAATIEKHARKFIKKIQKKTDKGSFVDAGQILKMALKLKAKKNLSDAAFKRFTQLYTNMLKDKYSDSSVDLTVNKFARLFNTTPNPDMTRDMNIPTNDLATAQKIVDTYHSTAKLWSQLNIANLKYSDLDPAFIQSAFNKDMHDPLSYANPILVALFAIKNKVLEGRFLLSNFGNIFTRLYKKKSITGASGVGINDVELFEDMTRTKDDTVCSNKSIVEDYHRRQNLQLALIKCVMGFRSGRVFNKDYSEFDQLLVDCKATNSELPEYAYIRDEGITLLKLFAAFVFRPTLVVEDVQRSVIRDLPYKYVPFIDVKISAMNDPTNNQPVNLQDKLTSVELVRNNATGIIEQRISKHVETSNGVLIFYVNRKQTTVNYNNIRNGRPYLAGNLPVTLSSVEQANTTPVEASLSITTNSGDEFRLRSVVCIDVTLTDNNAQIISGNKTIFVNYPTDPSDDYGFVLYDPVNVSRGFLDPNSNQYISRPPVGVISETEDPSSAFYTHTFRYLARHYGTIYVYEKIPRIVAV